MRESKYYDKGEHHRPASETPLNGVSLAVRWWPNIECWLGSFVIFQGIRTSIKQNPISLWFFWGGGSGPPAPPPPLDPCMSTWTEFSRVVDINDLPCNQILTKLSACHKVTMVFLWVVFLTYLNLMDLPTIINWTNPFPILGVLGVIFPFYSNFGTIFCKQTVETLIRRRVLRRLIWVCTVCLCPTKRTLGLYGISTLPLKKTYGPHLRKSSPPLVSFSDKDLFSTRAYMMIVSWR